MTWKELRDKIDAAIAKAGRTDSVQVHFVYVDEEDIADVKVEVDVKTGMLEAL